MRILLSNDDGITAPGLHALARVFSDAGHEVVVAAPDGQRSAASHSLTLHQPLRVTQTTVPGALRAYAISGTPVDCVKLALRNLYPEAEFVLSGINHGYNAGTDVLYSGTVGAAMEGVLSGLNALAVSLAFEREDTYDLAARMALDVFTGVQRTQPDAGMLLSLNYPSVDRAMGLKVVPLQKSRYTDEYKVCRDEHGAVSYQLGGGLSMDVPRGEDDLSYLIQGYATLTALTWNLTDKQTTQALKTHFEA